MSKVLLRPAFAFIAHVSLAFSYVTAALLLLVPQVLALGLLLPAAAGSPPRGADPMQSLVAALLAQSATVALMGASTLLGLYLLGGTYCWTAAGLGRLRDAVERTASGDLSGRAARRSSEGDARKSVGTALWASLKQMNENLADIVGQVRSSAESIAQGAREIASGNANLSQRTEEQASTLEQTASGMEELATTVGQNAQNCKRASAAADDASSIAGEATEGMRQVAKTMAQIEGSSRHVTDIIGVIEGIAFQTNILALNAAVEAARAGEQGRGFAVVASEVRSLAQRSAEAAKEIKGLIQASVGDVESGAQLVQQAGGTMEKVLASVRQVNALINDIAEASTEQSSWLQEINQSIGQLENMTQQNAALVEQATAAALSFEDEAGRLLNVVGMFKMDRMEDRDKAIALVKKAVEHVRAKGLDQACTDFEDPSAGFMDGEFYIFGNTADGTVLCNGRNRGRRGQPAMNKKDAYGKAYVRDMVETALRKGRGWCDYHQADQAKGVVRAKSAYVEGVDNVVLGCGIYRSEAKAASARSPAMAARQTDH
jgi:methyl-accepting chemotaxis protein